MLDLLPRGSVLLVIQFGRRGARQPPRGPAHDGRGHLQIPQQRGGCVAGRRIGLPLRFQKQRGVVQNALPDGCCGSAQLEYGLHFATQYQELEGEVAHCRTCGWSGEVAEVEPVVIPKPMGRAVVAADLHPAAA